MSDRDFVTEVYMALCVPTGLAYFGRTALSTEAAWAQHVSSRHRSKMPLHEAILEHGAKSFLVVRLWRCSWRRGESADERVRLLIRAAGYWPRSYHLPPRKAFPRRHHIIERALRSGAPVFSFLQGRIAEKETRDGRQSGQG